MKQRSTTPVSSKGIVTRSALVAAAVLMGATTPLMLAGRAFAAPYDEQIKQLQLESDNYKQQASDLGVLAGNLQAELDKLTAQRTELQRQISQSQAKRDKLDQDIVSTKKKIADTKDALGDIIADMYVDDSISPLEMLASSNNIGDYVDKQEYRSSMQESLSNTIKQINKLKTQLEKQKKDVENVIKDQEAQKQSLAAKEAERAKLVEETKGQESAYQALAAKRNNEVEALREKQRKEMEYYFNLHRINVGSGSTSGGGYPSIWADAVQDTIVDSWGLYNRECVSYAAWKVASTGRFVPHFGGAGNANQWPSTTARYGIANGSTPKAGSVAIQYVGVYGHAMYVEAVNGDGTITVSDYNNNSDGLGWGRYHHYSRSAAGLTYIYF